MSEPTGCLEKWGGGAGLALVPATLPPRQSEASVRASVCAEAERVTVGCPHPAFLTRTTSQKPDRPALTPIRGLDLLLPESFKSRAGRPSPAQVAPGTPPSREDTRQPPAPRPAWQCSPHPRVDCCSCLISCQIIL